MRIALLTDIHANREGLSAVLADVRQRGVDRIAVLGDIVGYGPDPAWCTDRVARLAQDGALVLMGNHDAAIGAPDAAMNPTARAAIDWTRDRLDDGQRRFLADLPMTAILDDLFLVHASPESPGDWIYVTNEARARGGFAVAKERVIACGHVHVPRLFSQDFAHRIAVQHAPVGAAIPLIRSRRWLAVVGAVGQPRDGVPQAAWALYDSARNEFGFRRVPYDAAATAAKIRAAGLPESLARRIMQGD